MTSLSLSIQLSQCNSTATESVNGGHFKREMESDLFFKLSRNNWHGASFAKYEIGIYREWEQQFFTVVAL